MAFDCLPLLPALHAKSNRSFRLGKKKKKLPWSNTVITAFPLQHFNIGIYDAHMLIINTNCTCTRDVHNFMFS